MMWHVRHERAAWVLDEAVAWCFMAFTLEVGEIVRSANFIHFGARHATDKINDGLRGLVLHMCLRTLGLLLSQHLIDLLLMGQRGKPLVVLGFLAIFFRVGEALLLQSFCPLGLLGALLLDDFLLFGVLPKDIDEHCSCNQTPANFQGCAQLVGLRGHAGAGQRESQQGGGKGFQISAGACGCGMVARCTGGVVRFKHGESPKDG